MKHSKIYKFLASRKLNKFLWHKKSMAIEDLAELLFFMVVFVFVIYFFTISSATASTKESEQVKFYMDKIEAANGFLIYYVSYPIDKDKTVADLIAESAVNDDYKNLDQITRGILSEYFSDDAWRILIKDSDGNRLQSIVGSHFVEYRQIDGEIALPLPEKNGKKDIVKVEFSFGE